MKKFLLPFALMLCVGTTHADECADGYSVLDDSGLCKIQCNGDALQNHPCVPVGMGYYSPDGTLYYGMSTSRHVALRIQVSVNNNVYSIVNAEDAFCPNGFDPNP